MLFLNIRDARLVKLGLELVVGVFGGAVVRQHHLDVRVEERIRQYELETGCRVIRLSDGEGFFCKNIG